MHQPFADKKLDAGRDYFCRRRSIVSKVCLFFMSWNMSEQKLFPNTCHFFVGGDAELFDLTYQ